MTLAILKFDGMFPLVFMVLYSTWRGPSMWEHASESTAILSPSGPAADVLFVFLIAVLISFMFTFHEDENGLISFG